MSSVSIRVSSPWLGDVTIDVKGIASWGADAERAQIAALLSDALNRARGAYGIETSS